MEPVPMSSRYTPSNQGFIICRCEVTTTSYHVPILRDCKPRTRGTREALSELCGNLKNHQSPRFMTRRLRS